MLVFRVLEFLENVAKQMKGGADTSFIYFFELLYLCIINNSENLGWKINKISAFCLESSSIIIVINVLPYKA